MATTRLVNLVLCTTAGVVSWLSSLPDGFQHLDEEIPSHSLCFLIYLTHTLRASLAGLGSELPILEAPTVLAQTRPSQLQASGL